MRHPPPLKFGRGVTRRIARRERGLVRRMRLHAFRFFAWRDGPSSPGEAMARYLEARRTAPIMAELHERELAGTAGVG